MNISQRLRTCAKHTGLDAVIELLNEAADEIDALQARAQVQGEPSWWMRETAEGVEWTDTAPLVLSGWTPLYTTPQPAQAAQAEVTDAQINAAYRDWCKTNGTPESFARAILALRPVQVPMTEEEIVHAYCGCKVNDAPAGVWFEAGARAAEKHHFGTKLKEQA